MGVRPSWELGLPTLLLGSPCFGGMKRPRGRRRGSPEADMGTNVTRLPVGGPRPPTAAILKPLPVVQLWGQGEAWACFPKVTIIIADVQSSATATDGGELRRATESYGDGRRKASESYGELR